VFGAGHLDSLFPALCSTNLTSFLLSFLGERAKEKKKKEKRKKEKKNLVVTFLAPTR